ILVLEDPVEDDVALAVAAAADIFGHTHATDAGLEIRFWQGLRPPDLATILRGAVTGAPPDEQARYQAVRDHYRERACQYLILLSIHFEFAKFLGIGLDDDLGENINPASKLRYRIAGGRSTNPITVESGLVDLQAGRDPRPPEDV